MTKLTVDATVPHSDVDATVPYSDVDATVPHSDVDATVPHSDVEAIDPQPDVTVVVSEPTVEATIPQPDVVAVVSEPASINMSQSTAADSDVLDTDHATAEPELLTDPNVPLRRYGWVYSWTRGSYREGKENKWITNHITDRVEISDRVWYTKSRIPSVATGRRPRIQVPDRFRPATLPLTKTPIPDQLSPVLMPHSVPGLPAHSRPIFLPMKPIKGKARGKLPYCPARPKSSGRRHGLGYAALKNGRGCVCRGHSRKAPCTFRTVPKKWATTPAESGIDRDAKPKIRNKTVRWAEEVFTIFPGEKPED